MKSLRKCMFGLMVLGVLGMTSCNDSNKSGTKIDITPGSNHVTSSHAIINGQPITDEWTNGVVSLYMPEYQLSNCTGTLIHPRWVLTAAHCIADETIEGLVLSEDTKHYTIAVGNNIDELNENYYPIKNYYYPDDYGTNDYGDTINDFALIELKNPIPESVAKPFPLLSPENGITRERIESEGIDVEFVGFGVDEDGEFNYKQYFSTKIISYCGASDNDNVNGCYYGTVIINGCRPDDAFCDPEASDYEDYAPYCSTGRFCFENEEYEVTLPFGSFYYEQDDGGTCQGDSGGPAFVRTEINGIPTIAVAGITSFGDPTCTKTGVDTAVQDFYDIIMETAPEIELYYLTEHSIQLGECDDAVKTLCDTTMSEKEDYAGYSACSILKIGEVWCGYTCDEFNDEETKSCVETCNDDVKICDNTGNGLKVCVDGNWQYESCSESTPVCMDGLCVNSEVDWCTFHWMETSTENSTATGYGRILIPSGNPEDIKHAYMACTDDITKPVSEWTRMDAEMNSHCSDCGQNSEYMSSVYQASSNNYYCTFVFEYKDEVIACRPQQDGDSEPIPIHSDTTLDIQNTRVFANE